MYQNEGQRRLSHMQKQRKVQLYPKEAQTKKLHFRFLKFRKTKMYEKRMALDDIRQKSEGIKM